MYAPYPNQPARTRPVVHIPVAGDDAGSEKPAATNTIAPSHPAKFSFKFMVVVLSSGAILTVRAPRTLARAAQRKPTAVRAQNGC